MCTRGLLSPILYLHDPAVTAVDDRVEISLLEVPHIVLNCIFCELLIGGQQDNDVSEIFGPLGEVRVVPL